MRSNLFASTLAIALGIASPIVGAIVFPEIAVAGFASVKVVPKLTPLEVKQKEDQDQHNLEIELSALQQSLISYRQKGDQKSEFETAVKISDIYFKLENPKESEKIIRDYLNLLRYKKDYNSEEFLVEIIRQYIKNWNFKAGYGIVSNQYISNRYRRGEISWDKVLEFSTFNLYISRIIKDYEQEIDSLHGMGWSYRNLGKFDNAINYYKEAIDVSKLKGKSLFKAMFLHIEIGTVYTDMGLYNEALDSFNLSLNLSSLSNLNDDEKGGLRKFALTRIGLNYIKSGNYDLALKYLEEADSNRIIGLNIDRHNLEIGLAEIYYRQGKYDLSLRTYENIYSGTLDVSDREYNIPTGDASARGEILNRIGLFYVDKQNYEKAIEAFQKALVSLRSLKNLPGEALTLSNIAFLLEKQNQPELAITFYKESINITESIRQNLRRMTIAEQRAYTESISKTYRSLANLLLSQGRVLEAQQVLELLKNQELRDYTKDTRSTSPTNGSPLNPLEAPIPAAFNDKISLGNQLTECDRQRCSDRSKLNTQVTNANKTFIALVTKLKDGLRSQEIKDPAQLQTDKLTIAAQKVILANPNAKTVLIYPLVLDDKLWLVWGSQAGKSGVIFDSQEIPVTRKDLSEKVRQLQEKLSTPNSNPKELQQVSQQLYQWLIQPIRQQLDDNKVQQIVFSLDRATRYIPMGTLHDGKQYLIENFALSTILTADIDTTDKLAPNPQDSPILGLGLTQAIAGLNALPAVETEINAIVRTDPTSKNGIYPGTKLFNQDFTEQSLRDNISGRRILHIATHGSFVPGNPEDSFLVLGNGQKLSISAIRSITDLANTHLVVLSACETGKGGVDKEGIEVAGLGHYFLLSGAKSVLTSLWLVNDPATSLLMNRFYTNLSQGNLSKAEALRQVQIAFINGKLTDTDAKALDRAGVRLYLPGQLPHGSFAHPYYWAPFILIGNSL